MKNECNIISDLLPLYTENMVSDDTVSFIEEHLKHCSQCSGVYQQMKEDGTVIKREDSKEDQEIIQIMKKLRKKIFQRICMTSAAVCLAVLTLLICLQIFPVYRLFQYHSKSPEINEHKSMLAYIGTPGDRKIAEDIVNYANIHVFSDISRTSEENLALYGPLGRYPFDKNILDEFNGLYETHSIELLSARIDEDHGYIFVEYSQQALGAQDEVISGSWNILSLWEVEKDSTGRWKVIKITEDA